MLLGDILSVRSPPPLCEWSKFCVMSIIVDHLSILSLAFMSSCRLSVRQLGVAHVHLDQAALRTSSREKVRTVLKHRNLPELLQVTAADSLPKTFLLCLDCSDCNCGLNLDTGPWDSEPVESYATMWSWLLVGFNDANAICTTIFVHCFCRRSY